MNKEHVGKNHLHAYVDGQLSATEAARVANHLASHADDQAAIDDWLHQRVLLHTAYDSQLDAALPAPLTARLLTQRRPQTLRIAIAAGWMALGIAIGAVAEHHLSAAPEGSAATLQSLPQRAAVAYAVFTPEVRHPVEVGADQEAHLVAWLSKRLGSVLHTPQLTAEGFRLVGGRLIPSDNGPGALLMYEDNSGQRLTLYVCADDKDSGTTAFRFAHQGGLSTFYWVDGRKAYALSGKFPRETLLPIASTVYRQLNDRPQE